MLCIYIHVCAAYILPALAGMSASTVGIATGSADSVTIPITFINGSVLFKQVYSLSGLFFRCNNKRLVYGLRALLFLPAVDGFKAKYIADSTL